MTEARQKAEERLAKELGAEYEAETGGVYFTSGTSILVREILWKALVDREQELEKYRSTVAWIASQQNLFFAECSQAEEIIAQCKECLGALPEAPKKRED